VGKRKVVVRARGAFVECVPCGALMATRAFVCQLCGSLSVDCVVSQGSAQFNNPAVCFHPPTACKNQTVLVWMNSLSSIRSISIGSNVLSFSTSSQHLPQIGQAWFCMVNETVLLFHFGSDNGRQHFSPSVIQEMLL
jgi:hypothetical protein